VLDAFPHFIRLTVESIQALEHISTRKYIARKEAIRRESLTKKQLHSDLHKGNAGLDDAEAALRERNSDLNVRESYATGFVLNNAIDKLK
jgi:hypothetical protein